MKFSIFNLQSSILNRAKRFALLGVVLTSVLCPLSSFPQTFRREALVSFTNTPAQSNALAVNGDSRLWLTNATAGTNHISIGATLAASATNLFGHLSARPLSNGVSFAWLSSTSLLFSAPIGSNLTVVASVPVGASNWASVTYRTNTVQAPYTPIGMPLPAAMSVATRSNAMTLLLSNLWKYAEFGLLPVTPAQIAATYAPLASPTVTDTLTVSGTPALWLGDSSFYGWGFLTDPDDTALIVTNENGGSPLWFTTRTNTPQSFSSWEDSTNIAAALISSRANSADYAPSNNPALWWDRDANGGFWLQPVTDGLMVRWQDAEVGLFMTNVIFRPIGHSSHEVEFPNSIGVVGTVYATAASVATATVTTLSATTATLSAGTATNFHAALLSTTFQPRAATSLVNTPSANADINAGTNTYLRLSGATDIASIAGFTAQPDGAFRIVQFSGAITNLILNESGLEGTQAHRILTGTGGDLSLTNQPAFLELLYDGAAARWRVVNHSQ